MMKYWPPTAFADERLAQHARVVLHFPRVLRALAAFTYGVSPHADVVVDVDASRFRVGARAGCAIPLSRLVAERADNARGAHLTHAFAAHAWAYSSTCSMTDLLDDSAVVCERAGVGRSIKSAISRGHSVNAQTSREAADRIDILLVLLAGETCSKEIGAAKTALRLVSSTGADPRGMSAWVIKILARLDWTLDETVATAVLRSAFPPAVGVSARERFAARNDLAEALSDG